MNALRALLLGTPIAILAAVVVACGPGNNGPIAGVIAPGSTGPTSTLPAFTSSGAVPLAASIGVPIALPTGGGVGGTLTIPAGSTVPAGTVLSGTLSSGLPAGAPTLSSIARSSTASRRGTQGETSSVFGLLFGQLSLTNPITITGTTSFTFTFPAGFVAGIPSTFSVYIAMYDPTRPTLGWLDRVIGCTTSVSANAITCTFTGTANIPANVTYTFALYAVATSAASPSPAPSVSIVAATPNPNQVTYNAGAPTLALPSEGGISASVALPTSSPSSGTTITGVASSTASGAFLPNVGGTDINTVLYVGSLTPSTNISFPGNTTITFAFKSPASISNPNALYYLATYDSSQAASGWFAKSIGPGVVNMTAGTITFNTSSSTNPSFAFNANNQYGFALYVSNSQPLLSVVTSTSGQTPNWPANSAGLTGAISVQPASGAGVGNTLQLTMGVTVASPIPTLAPSQGSVAGVIGYGVITNTGTTSVTETTTSFGFNVPSSAPANGTYYLAFYDTSISPATGWFLGALGPATASNGFVFFATNQPATFQPSTTAAYGIALYYK